MDLISEYSCNKKSMYYSSENNDLKHIGFLSLKVALENYFSTYATIKDSLIETNSKGIYLNEFSDIKYNNDYCEACSETIIHFQHFFELIIKDILEKESPLLAIKANTNNIILHKLINGEAISKDDYDKLYSIEFSEAISRLTDLVKVKRIDDRYIVFKDNKKVLDALNTFRNRMWHRGMFLLRYDALDEFVGKYILPIVKDIMDMEEYSKYKELFVFNNDINIGIIDELINENKNHKCDSSKIAFLKEMGRASYNLDKYNSTINNYDYFINEMGSCGLVLDVGTCPVCGKKTLILWVDYEENLEELCSEFGYQSKNVMTRFEGDRECINCHFNINKYIPNLKDIDFDFDDFWRNYDTLDE